MRFRPAGGLDLATGALILGGASLIAASIVAAVVLVAPPGSLPPTRAWVEPAPNPTPALSLPRTSAALPEDRVATVLNLDTSAGAGGAARSGDHVDVLGYFSHQTTGADAVTRVLVQDTPVMSVERSGANVALTLAVPRAVALSLHDAQALGGRVFVLLRPDQASAEPPASFSDTDLAKHMAEVH